LLRNEAITVEEMAAEAARRTASRCVGHHVLAIQDTTVVRPDGRNGGGDHLHATIIVDAEGGSLLGLTDVVWLNREGGKKASRRSRTVEDKESQRWIDGATRAAQACAGASRITHVADREADIFALFARKPAGTELLIRCAHDRALDDGGRLFAALDALPVAGRAELDLPAGPGRKARTASVACRILKAAPLLRPRHGRAEDLPRSLTVTIIDIREEIAPSKSEAVHWRLITTHDAPSAAEAFVIADLYRRRWAIEQVFRILKTKGFDVEGVLIEEEAPLKRLVTAALIAAVTIQQLVHARDGEQGPGPLRPMTDAFEPEDLPLLRAFTAKLEGKTQRQKNPHPQGSLAYGAWVCARLGGWTGYYGKPGPIVMLGGWTYFQAAKAGAALTDRRHDV
jgi:hypothetical protein